MAEGGSALIEQLNEQRRKVDYDTFDITVKQLMEMVAERNIDVAPVYQRHFRWKADRQSQYIESVLLGIPVPSLFMAANADGTWELVDGLQRLNTLAHFAGSDEVRRQMGFSDSLRLEGLDKLSEFNGLTFEDLPQATRMQFVLKGIKVITITDKSDAGVRFDVFERLNKGGIALTAQEIRACVYRGEFNDFLDTLSENKLFSQVVLIPPDRQKDGTPQEMVLRFFAFLNGYKQFEHSVVSFLNDYMKAAGKDFDYAHGRQIFTKTFKQLAKAFPHGIRRGRNATPINLFEAVAVGAALAVQQNGQIRVPRSDAWLTDAAFVRATTEGTNNRRQVKLRIEHSLIHFGGTP
ncbi:MAG TPA: DUF262 domain-containing protein [Vicinamibacterales bacterium]|nr:DUF262 domain-containing protein [Vicinamibacterales bacterium]